jgi:hypothetical protein
MIDLRLRSRFRNFSKNLPDVLVVLLRSDDEGVKKLTANSGADRIHSPMKRIIEMGFTSLGVS